MRLLDTLLLNHIRFLHTFSFFYKSWTPLYISDIPDIKLNQVLFFIILTFIYSILFYLLVILSKLHGIRLGLAHISWLNYKYISVCWLLLPPSPIALTSLILWFIIVPWDLFSSKCLNLKLQLGCLVKGNKCWGYFFLYIIKQITCIEPISFLTLSVFFSCCHFEYPI